jgi:hypothetical protein
MLKGLSGVLSYHEIHANTVQRKAQNFRRKSKRQNAPMNQTFDYSLDYSTINFRQRPELYRIGKGEQGVLLVEPYKSEILPHWRFKTPAIARQSATTIYQLFLRYKADNDFVGMDMARKFLQMGYTRARRYANHASGRKYDSRTGTLLPRQPDAVKAAAAREFYGYWQRVRTDQIYQQQRRRHQQRHETNTKQRGADYP